MTGAAQTSGKLWTRTFITLAAINFSVALPFYLIMVIMTDFSMQTYGVDYSVAAFSVTVFIISALVTRFFIGGKIDDWGVKRMLVIGQVFNLVSCMSYLFPMPFVLLLIMRIIQGVGFAITSGCAAAAVAIILEPTRRAEGIGYFSMTQALATGIGPFLAVLLINITGNYFALFLTTAIVTALSFASTFTLQIDSPEQQQRTRSSEADDALSKVSIKKSESDQTLVVESITAVDSEPDTTAPDTSVPTERSAAPRRGLSRFLHLPVLLMTPTLFLVYLGYSGLVSFVVPFANERGLSDIVSVYFVLYAAAILITRPPVGKFVDKHGERPLVYITILTVAAGLAILACATNGVLLLASSVLLGFGIGATQSILQAVVARDVPMNELGRANSTFFMSMDLGAGVGPVLIGVFIPVIGFTGCYFALAVGAVLACALYVVLGQRFTRFAAGDR